MMHSMRAPEARAICVIFEHGWKYWIRSDAYGVVGVQSEKYQRGAFRVGALKWLCRKQADELLGWVGREAQFLGLELKNASNGIGLLNS